MFYFVYSYLLFQFVTNYCKKLHIEEVKTGSVLFFNWCGYQNSFSIAVGPFFSFVSEGNQTNNSFNKAKKNLERAVYLVDNERKNIYCEAAFNKQKNIFS